MNRRQFLTTSAALVGASSVAGIEPLQRTSKVPLRLSLAAYSFRQELDLKQPKPPLTLAGFIDLAAEYGVDAVELTGYYFAERSPAYLGTLKRQAARLGLEISGSAVGNDFCIADDDKRAEQRTLVNEWLEYTNRLGGKTLRVFAGKVAKGDNEDKARERCVAELHKACVHAANLGVYVALENHGGITATAEQLLALVKAVDHPNFGVNLDTGNFRTADPYADLAKLAPYAVNVQVKTEIFPAGAAKEEADLARIVSILKAANYRGYVALEYEAAAPVRTAAPKYLAQLRKLLA